MLSKSLRFADDTYEDCIVVEEVEEPGILSLADLGLSLPTHDEIFQDLDTGDLA